ncbi:ankyrin [Xylaria acuta]|nr:ankyrin [Xylaria acuta]
MAAFPPSYKIGEEEWDLHQNLIISLYLGKDHEESESLGAGEDQIKGKTLDEVAESMRGYGFNASVSQLEARLNAWGARKNLKPEEWEQVHERLDMLPQATKSRVLISGRVVADSKIKRARRYRKQKFRTANRAPMAGSSSLSALSHHVHIEVQEPDGRWVQLSNSDTAPTLVIPHPPRTAIVEEGSAAELSVSSPIPMTLTSPRSTARNSHCSLDVSEPLRESIQEYRLEYPTTWLGSLPSRRIISAMREYGLCGVGHTRNTALHRSMSTGMIEWDNGMSYSRFSDASPQSPKTIGAGQYSGYQNERNQRIMTPADVCRSKFSQFLLSAVLNGTCEPDDIPAEVLDGLFGPGGAVNSLLLHCFKEAPHLLTTLVSTLLYALILQGKRDTIARLLDKGLVHVDNTVIFSRGCRFTPLEVAAIEGNEALVELLLSYRGDPNKSYHSRARKGRSHCHPVGALGSILEGRMRGSRRRFRASLNILHKLFEAGAQVRPDTNFNLNLLDEASASFVILQIDQSRHEEYFEREHWTKLLDRGEDVHAANLFDRVVADCTERHSGRCISRHQRDVDRALLTAALNGRTKTFLAISPHSSHASSDLNEQLLSAAIKGGQSVIINSAMLRRPNINPPPHHYDDPDFGKIYTTPLAQSILTKNAELIDCFSNAGIFESLHMDGRFGVALTAAAKIGDVGLVTRLLTSCPDLESHDMTPSLSWAIKGRHEELALLLLEKGASVYEGGWRGVDYGVLVDEYTLLAIQEGKKKIARKLLSIGEKGAASGSGFPKVWCLMDLDITESYLSSYHCGFRHWQDVREIIPGFDPAAQEDGSDQETAAALNTICDSMPDSKLATEQLLTACLAIAVSQNNPMRAQELIQRGANAWDETVLTCAVRQGTTGLFQLLLRNKDRQRPVVTKGLRTEVLKAAIRQGPGKYDLVYHLIESRLVDIFDTGHSERNGYGILTPLGEAIRAAEVESSQQLSYDVAKLLLDHGCGPNDIVMFSGGNGPDANQTAMLEAIGVGNQELVKLLIKYGADINPELRHLVRRTPLQKAAEKGDLAMVRLLLQQRADVNAKPAIAMGGTALQFAAISGKCDVACELLSHGAFLCAPPPEIGGRWPIEGAAEHGRIEMIEFLWKAKDETLFIGSSETGFQEKNFKKALRLAREHHHHACVELIAQLANLPVTATDIPPVISPMYIDWPPPERPVD